MAIITITATSLGQELISGIPRLVSLSTNVSATIFFTLDGSEPTTMSSVYLKAITMPTESPARLRALAVSGLDTGSLDVTYSTDSSDLSFPRRTTDAGLGVAVDAYDTARVVLDGYTAGTDGVVNVPARESDIALQDLEIKFSKTDEIGNPPGTLITLGMTPIEQLELASSISFDASSPNNNNVLFNPRSLYIVVDGRDGYEDQAVYPIMRPWAGTLDPTKYLQGKTMYEPQPYVSGGHVRTFYNGNTGTAVSYYFDHNETRWIKSIQNYDKSAVPAGIGSRKQSGGPLVFKWIYNKRSMI